MDEPVGPYEWIALARLAAPDNGRRPEVAIVSPNVNGVRGGVASERDAP